MATVRALHILSGDLAMRKRSLEPIKSLIYGLRRYDLERCVALASSSNEEEGAPKEKVLGFMSHKAKIYLVRPRSLLRRYVELTAVKIQGGRTRSYGLYPILRRPLHDP